MDHPLETEPRGRLNPGLSRRAFLETVKDLLFYKGLEASGVVALLGHLEPGQTGPEQEEAVGTPVAAAFETSAVPIVVTPEHFAIGEFAIDPQYAPGSFRALRIIGVPESRVTVLTITFPQPMLVSRRPELAVTLQGDVTIFATPTTPDPAIGAERVFFVIAPTTELSRNPDGSLFAERNYRYSLKLIPPNLEEVVSRNVAFYRTPDGLVMLKRTLWGISEYSEDGTREPVENTQTPDGTFFRRGQQEVVLHDPTQPIRYEPAPVFISVNDEITLNMRRTAGIEEGNIITSLSPNAQLLALGRGPDNWIWATDGTTTGFVKGDSEYVTVDHDDDLAGLPMVDASGNIIHVEEVPRGEAEARIYAMLPDDLKREANLGTIRFSESRMGYVRTNPTTGVEEVWRPGMTPNERIPEQGWLQEMDRFSVDNLGLTVILEMNPDAMASRRVGRGYRHIAFTEEFKGRFPGWVNTYFAEQLRGKTVYVNIVPEFDGINNSNHLTTSVRWTGVGPGYAFGMWHLNDSVFIRAYTPGDIPVTTEAADEEIFSDLIPASIVSAALRRDPYSQRWPQGANDAIMPVHFPDVPIGEGTLLVDLS